MRLSFLGDGDQQSGVRRQRRATSRRKLARSLRIEPLERRSLLSAGSLLGGGEDSGGGAGPLGTGGGLGDGASASLPVYYDYVEDGVLKGGLVYVDARDPKDSPAGLLGDPPPWNVVTVVDNGASENRIDLVVLGDGYTASDLSTYAAHVSSLVPAFFSQSPLNEYASFFNVHRVDVISSQSGVDNDPTQGILRDTALDMQYWCGGTERLLCVSVSKALAAAAYAPDSDQILALANSTKYGGAGYASNGIGTLAGANSSAIELALHEFGHSFAGLADEYEYGGGTVYTGPEPAAANVSIYPAAEMTSRQTKWYRWLPEANVDTFEGAAYYTRGIYRPTSNSKMRSLNRPFEQVNVEQFVLSAYRTVQPIDAATPLGTYPQGTVFFVDPVDPVGHALDVQWSLDGTPIPGATGTTFDSATFTLTSVAQTLSVRVVDNTPLVRDEAQRAQLMSRELAWTVTMLPTDFGDAPADYATLLVDDGARHALGGPFLGARVDSEDDGWPAAAADGDDTTPAGEPDDEDGITLLGPLAPGQTVSVPVDLQSSLVDGKLNAWIDFNGDGDWADAGEQIFTDVALTAGSVHAPSFTVPGVVKPGTTYARFRINTGGGLSFDGPAADGEVEDYAVEIAPPLTVTQFVPTDTGFVARFGRDFEPSVLNLYDSASQTLGAADVTVTGATHGPVRGSLVVSADRRQITFVRTAGLLEPDSYSVTLFSGDTRFREPTGGTLDGNADGTVGDDYQTTFAVSARPAGTVTISLPDIARGAGQPVNIPNTAAGLPLRLDHADGVTSLAVDLVYDEDLLDITAVSLAAGLPATWSVVNPPDTSTPGVAKIRASGTTALSGTDIEIVRITAAVPSGALYGAVQAIRLENVSLNSGSIGGIGDLAVHKAAYLGDADGSGIHSAADAFLVVQAGLGLASGFAAHAWVDPRIVGDADGSGMLSAADAFLIVQEGLGLSEPFVPDNPRLTVTPVGGGVDPQFQIGVNLPATAGGQVSVPVKLEIEAAATNVGGIDFDLFFDPSRLTIQVPDGISAGADTANGWAISSTLIAAGHLRLDLLNARGQPLAAGLREIAQLQFGVDESAADGPAALDIEPVDARAGGYTWTAVDGSVAIAAARAGRNAADPREVNGDGLVTRLDVLAAISYLNSPSVPVERPPATLVPAYCHDVNEDRVCTALDILIVVNHRNAQNAGLAEGELRADFAGELELLADTRRHQLFADPAPDLSPLEDVLTDVADDVGLAWR